MPAGRYIYMDYLLSLAERRPALPADLLQLLGPVNTSLNAEARANHLQSHPDRAYADYIIQAILHGFWLGFDYGMVQL